MIEACIAAINKLSDPIAIVLIISMLVNVMLCLAVARALPKVYQILGKHTALLEVIVFGKKGGA